MTDIHGREQGRLIHALAEQITELQVWTLKKEKKAKQINLHPWKQTSRQADRNVLIVSPTPCRGIYHQVKEHAKRVSALPRHCNSLHPQKAKYEHSPPLLFSRVYAVKQKGAAECLCGGEGATNWHRE